MSYNGLIFVIWALLLSIKWLTLSPSSCVNRKSRKTSNEVDNLEQPQIHFFILQTFRNLSVSRRFFSKDIIEFTASISLSLTWARLLTLPLFDLTLVNFPIHFLLQSDHRSLYYTLKYSGGKNHPFDPIVWIEPIRSQFEFWVDRCWWAIFFFLENGLLNVASRVRNWEIFCLLIHL